MEKNRTQIHVVHNAQICNGQFNVRLSILHWGMAMAHGLDTGQRLDLKRAFMEVQSGLLPAICLLRDGQVILTFVAHISIGEDIQTHLL